MKQAIARTKTLVANRVVLVAVFAIAAIGGTLLVTSISASPEPTDQSAEGQSIGQDQISESGRLLFYVIADAIPVDDSGKIVPGASFRAVSQSCEADALVQLDDGRVSSISRQGTATDIGIGDEVLGDISFGQHKVYRDNHGDLHLGCDPASWTIISVDHGIDSGLAP